MLFFCTVYPEQLCPDIVCFNQSRFHSLVAAFQQWLKHSLTTSFLLMAEDSQILQRGYTPVWMQLDFGRAQLCSAQSTQNFGEFFRSTSPSTAGMLVATLAKYPRSLDHLESSDSSFGALGKQRRHRTTSYNGASFSQAFNISPVSTRPPLV